MFASDTQRTPDTAAPLAKALNLTPKTFSYLLFVGAVVAALVAAKDDRYDFASLAFAVCIATLWLIRRRKS